LYPNHAFKILEIKYEDCVLDIWWL
jgi:hypothetical protein